MRIFIASVLTILAFSIFAITIKKSISLKQNCTGYLKRAADANTVKTAKEELHRAILYLEKNGLTHGYTSVLYKTPDEDVTFWYQNLKAAELELSHVDSTASSLEKTNLLMKLRETLMDAGEKKDKVTVPEGLSRFPDNAMWGTLIWSSVFILFGLFIWASKVAEKNSKAAKQKKVAIK